MTEPASVAVALHSERPISPATIRALYDHYDWWPERSESDLARVLELGGPAVGAWKGHQLVGFARAVSDGHFRAYIEDVVVHPEHRITGIATALLGRLLSELDRVDVVSLFCSAEHQAVYARSGFIPREDVVMHRYRTGDR